MSAKRAADDGLASDAKKSVAIDPRKFIEAVVDDVNKEATNQLEMRHKHKLSKRLEREAARLATIKSTTEELATWNAEHGDALMARLRKMVESPDPGEWTVQGAELPRISNHVDVECSSNFAYVLRDYLKDRIAHELTRIASVRAEIRVEDDDDDEHIITVTLVMFDPEAVPHK